MIENADVVVGLERFCQDGRKAAIDFKRRDVRAGPGERLCQRADAGADFQDGRTRGELCGFGDAAHDVGPYQKILAELVLHANAEAFDDVPDDFGAGEFDFYHACSPNCAKASSHSARVMPK